MRRLGRNFRLRQIPQIVWANYPDFYAPLTHSLLLSRGQGVATFTRATTATCWCYLENAIAGDSQVLQSIPSGIPRFEGARFLSSNNTWSNLLSDSSVIPESTLKGILIEGTSTNLFLQSATLATQNVTTSATTYTVSFTGTGTVVFSGAYIGTLVGTGANDRVSHTFTATAGTLISTVTGTCTNGQCEAKLMATSYIPTTTSTVTRNADVLTFPTANMLDNTKGTVYVEVSSFATSNTQQSILDTVSTDNGMPLYISAAGNLGLYDGSVRLGAVISRPVTNMIKVASKWGNSESKLFASGSQSGTTQGFDGSMNFGTNLGIGNRPNGALPLFGNVKNVKIWKRRLTDSQIVALTTP